MSVGPTQILIILLVLVVLFGASRLPQLGKDIGSGLRNFRKGLTDDVDDDKPKKLKSSDKAKHDA